MNISVYLFGDLSIGYTQYPNDYTHSIFKNFYQESLATTQLAIHRDNDLMYYGYIRKLDDNNYIGLCTVINGTIITQIDRLFTIYEEIIEIMVRNGYLIHFNDKGEIVSKVGKLYENREEIDLITSSLQISFNRLDQYSLKLPAVSYGTYKNSVKSFSIQDNYNDILKSSYTNGYTLIYKSKEYNTASINSYKGVIVNKNKKLAELQTECDKLRKQVSSLKNKQRNTLWVSIFAIAALILGVIVWTQVLFPSEVTKKDLGEYVYYGPMLNGEPNGIGVAIYHPNDSNKRLYYYGNFNNGLRQDTAAIMFYRDGSYFRGEMNDDHWNRGVMYYKSIHEHFEGSFDKNDNPQTGAWYECKKVQLILDGEPIKIR